MGTLAAWVSNVFRAFVILVGGLASLLVLVQGISQSIAASQRGLTFTPLLLGLISGALLAWLIAHHYRRRPVHAWQFVAVIAIAFADILLLLLRSAGL